MVARQPTLVFWCFALLLVSVVGTAVPESFSAPAPASDVDVRVEASVSPTVVAGMPCMMKILVTNHTPTSPYPPKDEWFKMSEHERQQISGQNAMAKLRIPAYLPFSNQPPPFSIEITNEQGVAIVQAVKPNLYAFFIADWEHIHVRSPDGGMMSANPNRFRRPTTTVRTDESAAFFIDFSPLLVDLEPGAYSLTVRLYIDHRSDPLAQSPPEQFELKSLPDGEWKMIRRAVPSMRDDPTQLDWLNPAIDAHLLHMVLPPDTWSNVAFHVLMGRAAFATTSDEFSPALIKLLPDHLRPVADVMRYELLLNTDDEEDEESATQLRGRLVSNHSELLWIMDLATDGKGLVAQTPNCRFPTDPTGGTNAGSQIYRTQ